MRQVENEAGGRYFQAELPLNSSPLSWPSRRMGSIDPDPSLDRDLPGIIAQEPKVQARRTNYSTN